MGRVTTSWKIAQAFVKFRDGACHVTCARSEPPCASRIIPSASAPSEISRALMEPAPLRKSIAAMLDTPASPSGSIHCPPRAIADTATTGVEWSSRRSSVRPFGSTSFFSPAVVARAPCAGHPSRHGASCAAISLSAGPVVPTGRTTE